MRFLMRCVFLVTLWPMAALAQSQALIKLPNFDGLADHASESINITLDEPLLRMASRFLSSEDADSVEAKKVLDGLRGIYVRSYTFDKPFEYPRGALEAIRKQLAPPHWNPLMEVKSSKEQANVGIYVSLDSRGNANGLVILSTEPQEFTVVNIVGAIDLDKLKNIEGKLGIPELDIEDKKKPLRPKR